MEDIRGVFFVFAGGSGCIIEEYRYVVFICMTSCMTLVDPKKIGKLRFVEKVPVVTAVGYGSVDPPASPSTSSVSVCFGYHRRPPVPF